MALVPAVLVGVARHYLASMPAALAALTRDSLQATQVQPDGPAKPDLGLFHLIFTTRCIKVGYTHQSQLRTTPDTSAWVATCRRYAQLFRQLQARMSRLPVVILCGSAAQAHALESFVHLYMRVYEREMWMDVGGSWECYSLMSQDVICEQVLRRARCTAAQLQAGISVMEKMRSLVESDSSRARQVKNEMETQMSQALNTAGLLYSLQEIELRSLPPVPKAPEQQGLL